MKTNLVLEKKESFNAYDGPLVLAILDGVGLGPKDDSNAVHIANTPILDNLMKEKLYLNIKAHGKAVGMPTDEDMGNSEVGHNTLGAGRVVDQGALLVKNQLHSKEIFKSKSWVKIIEQIKKFDSTLHLLGLLSDGNVHSHISHVKELINEAAHSGITSIRLHILLDGRDVDGRSAINYIEQIENHIKKYNKCDIKIASGGGRMIITMDRYNADWDMVQRGWETHVHGIGNQFKNATDAVTDFYNKFPQQNDQYITPFVIANNNIPVGKINDNDCVILFNFRGDRAIEISSAFDDDTFNKFPLNKPKNILFSGMLEYDADLKIPKEYLVESPKIKNTISEYLSEQSIHSFAISETQKYGHVTYFWNGNRSGYINKSLEKFIEIPSYNVPFDEKPEMRASEITSKSIELLKTKKYKFARINYPNGDMVGHTGNIEATVTSLEVVDQCLNDLLKTIKELKGICIIVADHGNADCMFKFKDEHKVPVTNHTLNPVPFIIKDYSNKNELTLSNIENPGLSNIAATILALLGYEKPEIYDSSLIKVN